MTAALISAQGRLRRVPVPGPVLPLELPEELELLANEITEYGLFLVPSKLSEFSSESRECLWPGNVKKDVNVYASCLPPLYLRIVFCCIKVAQNNVVIVFLLDNIEF